MRAWHFSDTTGGLENSLKLNKSAQLPPHSAQSLGKDKVLIQVTASALNPVDYKFAEVPLVGRLAITKPSSPGLDFSGRIAELGEGGSDGLKVGQLVFGRLDQPTQFGTLAEYTVARRAVIAAIPEGVKSVDAAAVGTAGLTAYQSIVPNVQRGKGDRVFINGGSGGTGVWGIQIAKAVGCHVVTTCSGKNAELCKSLGADEVIDYTQGDIIEALKKKSGEGGKFDLVVDNIGYSGNLYWQCHHFTSEKAKYVQIGAPMALYTVWEMSMKMLYPSFLGGGKRKFQMLGVSGNGGQMQEIARWMAEGKVKAVVDEVLAMEDAPKAFAKLKTDRTKGKIVVSIGEE